MENELIGAAKFMTNTMADPSKLMKSDIPDAIKLVQNILCNGDFSQVPSNPFAPCKSPSWEPKLRSQDTRWHVSNPTGRVRGSGALPRFAGTVASEFFVFSRFIDAGDDAPSRKRKTTRTKNTINSNSWWMKNCNCNCNWNLILITRFKK